MLLGLVGRSAASTVLSFTPSRPLGERELAELPAVGSVSVKGDRVELTGTDETVNAVVSLLARRHITAGQLRVTDATLDDAFLDLTSPTAPAPAPATDAAPPTATANDAKPLEV